MIARVTAETHGYKRTDELYRDHETFERSLIGCKVERLRLDVELVDERDIQAVENWIKYARLTLCTSWSYAQSSNRNP